MPDTRRVGANYGAAMAFGLLDRSREHVPARSVLPTQPDVYLTDGQRLFNVVVPLSTETSSQSPDIAFLEDCRTLSVHAFTVDELREMRLRLITPCEQPAPRVASSHDAAPAR